MMEGPRKDDLAQLADDSNDTIGPLPGALHDPLSQSTASPRLTLETVKEMFALSSKDSDEAEEKSDNKSPAISVAKSPPLPASKSSASANGKSTAGAASGKSLGAAGKSTTSGSTAATDPVFTGKAVAEAIRGETSHNLIEKLDKLLVDLRSSQLEEVLERKRKVNSLLKDPGLRI